MNPCVYCERLKQEIKHLNNQINSSNDHQLKTINEELHKELQTVRFQQLEHRLKNEKIFKDFLYDLKQFTLDFPLRQKQAGIHHNQIAETSQHLVDLFTKHYKTLLLFTFSCFNYSDAEMDYFSCLVKSLDSTFDRLRSILSSAHTDSSSLRFTPASSPITYSHSDSSNENLISSLKISELNRELNEFKLNTSSLRDKLQTQRSLIDSLIDTFSSANAGLNSNITNVTPLSSVDRRYSTTYNSNTTSNSEIMLTSSSSASAMQQPVGMPSLPDYADNSTSSSYEKTVSKEQDQLYVCPKCSLTVASDQIVYKKYLSHVKKCDVRVNRGCVFCMKLYEIGQEESRHALEGHVQKHMLSKESGASRRRADTVMSQNEQYDDNDDQARTATDESVTQLRHSDV